jgi:hypothetical protein
MEFSPNNCRVTASSNISDCENDYHVIAFVERTCRIRHHLSSGATDRHMRSSSPKVWFAFAMKASR